MIGSLQRQLDAARRLVGPTAVDRRKQRPRACASALRRQRKTGGENDRGEEQERQRTPTRGDEAARGEKSMTILASTLKRYFARSS